MFDKTSTFYPIPEDLYTGFGLIDEGMRRHIYPTFPPETGTGDLKDFPKDLPNIYVEGWQRQVFRIPSGPLRANMRLYRYGAVIRSPWTWLGYPFIPTQAMLEERPTIVQWYEDEYKKSIDQSMINALKLLDG